MREWLFSAALIVTMQIGAGLAMRFYADGDFVNAAFYVSLFVIGLKFYWND